ncbi:MAG: hypothetical protein JSW25_00990, partial [Thermoplasmata archaeon]
RYYLDVWGHGGGWRDGTCNDYTSGSVIDTDELGVALGEARDRTNVTLDGLGFDQCLMAQLEVFYEIKQYGDVLVGAESLIPADGYNYTRVMMALVADPDMDASALADVIVTAFFDEYGHDNERAHSAVDAELMDARLSPALTRMAQLLRANASTYHDEIKLARDLAQTYSTLDYIDLGNFTEHLLLKLPQNETALRQAVVKVQENVTASVIAEDHGIGRSGSTGLTFYFPRYGVAWSYANLEISLEGRWDEFLDAYFDRKDRPNVAPTVEVESPLPGSVVGLEFTMEGTANDTDGSIGHVEYKFDRGPWQRMEAGDEWSVDVSTAGLDPGLHRVSVRSRDDTGDYSPEVQFALNVESKGLELSVDPGSVRTYPGGSATTTLEISAFGNEGGNVQVEVVSSVLGWSVGLPFTVLDIPARGSENGTMMVDVDPGSSNGVHQVVVRAWMTDAPLIQAFTVLTVEVVDRMPDLVVEGLTIEPATPLEGDDVIIGLTVRNKGLVPAIGFDVELWHVFDPGVNNTTSLLLREHLNQLPVGEAYEVWAEWKASIGLHEFVAKADAAANNSDLHRDDNELSRLLLLQGYDVRLEAAPTSYNVTPGEEVLVNLTVHNMGNLRDSLALKVERSDLGWDVRFNETVFLSDPRQVHPADMWVTVPEGVTGGTVETITVRLYSSSDYSKFQDVNVTLSYPEVFGMRVEQDRETETLGPMATESFNITIENTGNGYENYTLDYIRQLDHLFISAVNDTVELPPGASTTVEVFFSTLDTDVGGLTFSFDVRVRSRDNPTVVADVSFSVEVERVFGIEAEFLEPSGGYEVLPSVGLVVTVKVTSHSNYPVVLEVHMDTGSEVFETPAATQGEVGSGATEEFNIVLVAYADAIMGTYPLALSITESVNIHNVTMVTADVEVLRVDESSLRVEDANATVLRPGVTWSARLELVNDGNHPETYTVNTSFVPKWLRVELSQEEVTLDAYSSTFIDVTVSLKGDGGEGKETVMLVVNAHPANRTDGSPQVVLDIAMDVPEDEGSVSWVMVVGLLVATVVVLAVLVYVRSERLRS